MNNVWWTPARISKLIELLECHASIDDIMAHFKQSKSSVRNAIKRYTFGMRLHRHIGVKGDLEVWVNNNYPNKPRKKHKKYSPREPRKWTPEKVNQLKELAKTGACAKGIARAMGENSVIAIRHALSKYTDGLGVERKK